MSKFAVFDIDGTLIRWQLFHAIAHHLGKHGHIDQTTHERIRSARMDWKNRSDNNSFKLYEDVLVQAYFGSLVKIDPADYLRIVDDVFDEYKDQLFVYTRDLLKTLKSDGYLLFAISGSQNEIVQKLANYHGFDVAVGAELVMKDGRYTGEVKTPVHDKAATLEQLVKTHGTSYKGSIAVGDSASDIAMLEKVENPIAFNPEQSLFAHAYQHNWKIVVERKNVVYQLDNNDGQYILTGES